MDKREAREFLGTNHHYNPAMNVIPGQPPVAKKKWGVIGTTVANPLRIRQNSVSSDTSSPVGSPTEAPDFSQLERRNSKTLYNSFGFTN